MGLSLTAQAHAIAGKNLSNGDIAIDATLGNGHDLLFLAKKVGVAGKIFGFDIQEQALQATRCRLENEISGKNITLNQACHAQMSGYIPKHLRGKIKVIMFNLGYLPGANKSVITQVDSTLSALQQSLDLLAPSGVITLLAYPGHEGGAIETRQIDLWCKQLNQDCFNTQLLVCSEKATAPRLFIIKKRTGSILSI